MPHLSKSRYRNFLKCPRLGYLSCYPERFQELARPSLASTIRTETGSLVGEVARGYWPGGTLIDTDHRDMGRALALTEQALASGATLLYEGTFSHDDILVRADILRQVDDGTWHLIEVKSSSDIDKKLKEYIPDVGIQLHVLCECGLPVSRAFLMHLNKDYVHPGGPAYDLHELFAARDLTAEAQSHIERELPGNLAEFRRILGDPEPPYALVKNACRGDCDYSCEYCLPLEPDFRVTEMGRAWRVFDVFREEGVDDLRDVSPENCPRAYEKLCRIKQAPIYLRMIDSVKRRELVVAPGLAQALDEIEYPAHFFDFEGWGPALPVLAGTKPYQQVPFQWSDHCLTGDGGLDHEGFLADGLGDPRREVAESLLERLGDRGSVVVYHKDYEVGRLTDLADVFPDLADHLHAVVSRIVDLEPIVIDHVYHPHFHGSFSLKKVYPALVVAGSGYDDLAIQQGDAAAQAYAELRLMDDGPGKKRLREDMLAYCGMDTMAMVELYWELGRLAG